MSTALAPRDAERLTELEAKVEKGLTTFVEVGAALAEIRDSRLYRETHKNFTDYARERFGMSKPYATQMIGAAEVVQNVVAIATTAPANEAQARPLTAIKEPEKQREAWTRAVETAPKDEAGVPNITAAHVKKVVQESQGVVTKKDGSIDKLATMRAQREAAATEPPAGTVDLVAEQRKSRAEFEASAWGILTGYISNLPVPRGIISDDMIRAAKNEGLHKGFQTQAREAAILLNRIVAILDEKEDARVSA